MHDSREYAQLLRERESLRSSLQFLRGYQQITQHRLCVDTQGLDPSPPNLAAVSELDGSEGSDDFELTPPGTPDSKNNTNVATDESFATNDDRGARTVPQISGISEYRTHLGDGERSPGAVATDLAYLWPAARSPTLSNVVATMLRASAKKNGPDRLPLLEAVVSRQSSAAIEMLDNDADPNEMDESGRTPLLEAVMSRQSSVALEILQKGADPNKKDGFGQIPLLEAVRSCQSAVAIKMLDEGAGPNVEDGSGQTPLLEAVESCQSTVAIKMLQKGADPNKKNGSGQIPLLEAVRSCQSAVAIEMLEKGATPETKDESGQTPLLEAVKSHQSSLVTLMLRRRPGYGTG